YIRQSTMTQVRFHTESTERQYALQEKALQWGWLPDQIQLIDEDLGLSGSQSSNRQGFQHLVTQVTLGQVGAIFGLEISRLARSSADLLRLLELCALFDTIIIDEDGVYNLNDFNDRLILGFKGTMSEAELHFLRARLLGGKLNKARKGELRFPLPVGYCHDEEGKIIIDPDEYVQTVVKSVFTAFQVTGSAYGVVKYFAEHGLRF
ncbi:recombinase family protein, partial [Cutibacterium acnes]